MFYFCILAAIVASIAFAHTLPVMFYVMPACFLAVLLPSFEVSFKKMELVHMLLVTVACVIAVIAIFVLRSEVLRTACMVFTVVYLLSRFMRLLTYQQRRFAKEQKAKADHLSLRRARNETVEKLNGSYARERVTIHTTHENEKWFLAIAERFSRHGWNVRVDFLENRTSGRFRIVYTAPASADVLAKSIRAVRTEAL